MRGREPRNPASISEILASRIKWALTLVSEIACTGAEPSITVMTFATPSRYGTRLRDTFPTRAGHGTAGGAAPQGRAAGR